MLSKYRSGSSAALLLGLCALLQFTVTSPLAQSAQDRADDHFQAGNWQAAVESYQAVLRLDPEQGQAWLRLGLSLHQLGDYGEACDAYARADSLGFAPGFVRYKRAAAEARQGNTDESLRWLAAAIEAGYSNYQALDSDADFTFMRSDPRFADLRQAAERQARPCAFDERYRQLDFWVGEWDVYNQQGQQVGINFIQKLEEGCLVLENWTSMLGTTGKSMNYFDPASGAWKQLWVDQAGRIIRYVGRWEKGAMRLLGEHVQADGSSLPSRMTLTPLEGGRVHQLIEQSATGDGSWQVWFDGIYVPKV